MRYVTKRAWKWAFSFTASTGTMLLGWAVVLYNPGMAIGVAMLAFFCFALWLYDGLMES